MLVLIPAKGESTRIPRKNLHLLAGRPLIDYTLEAAKQAAVSNSMAVSTEDSAIAERAREAGFRVVARPANLASETASTEQVVLHALDAYVQEGTNFDWVMVLPPTSPLRSAETIRRCASEQAAHANDHDCLMTVTETRPDLWRGNEDGSLQRLFQHAPRRQQDREILMEENSAVYIVRTKTLRETGSFIAGRVRGVPIAPKEALDINDPLDIELAEALLSD